MERLNYPEVVQTILKNHVKNSPNSQTEVQLIFDKERDRYPFTGVELRTEANSRESCQTNISLISLPSNRVNEVANLVFEA